MSSLSGDMRAETRHMQGVLTGNSHTGENVNLTTESLCFTVDSWKLRGDLMEHLKEAQAIWKQITLRLTVSPENGTTTAKHTPSNTWQ